MSSLGAWLLVLAGLWSAGQEAAPRPPELVVRELAAAAAEAPRVLELWKEGLAGGEPAALAALALLAEGSVADLRARRLLAALAAEAGRAAALAPARALLADPDPELRASVVRMLGARELRAEQGGERAAALEELARSDPSSAVRASAIAALERVEHAAAVAALERLALRLPDGERITAARALAAHDLGREVLIRAVQDGLAAGDAPADVLAEWLGGPYGTALAETPSGGEAPADRLPFLLAGQHPDAAVRAAVEPAVDLLVARLRFLGELARADRVLAALQGQGLDDGMLLARRVRLALETGGEPERALDLARQAAERARAGGAAIEARKRLAAASLFEAAARLALGEHAEAAAPVALARDVLDGLLAERLDRPPVRQLETHVELLQRRGVLELYEGLRRLMEGLEPGDPRVLRHAREVHLRSLEAQGAQPDDGWPYAPGSMDALLSHAVSPLALVLANTRNPRLPRQRSLELEQRLLEALATVAPLEMPGFERATTPERQLASPFEDPARLVLLQRMQAREITAVRERLRIVGREFRLANPGLDLDESMEWRSLAYYLDQLIEQQRRDPEDGYRGLWLLRSPSDAALDHAESLRENGRSEAARALVERLRVDLAAAEGTARSLWGELLAARAEVAQGTAWMDDGEPARAEELLLRALARVETLEQDMELRQPGSEVPAQLRTMRANVLVSLAVNANVKLREVQKALDYFERAFALRDDDFMRVLLACYRARAGKTDEARQLLQEVPVSPANFYNLACTWALLHERELALDFLQRSLEELALNSGGLERQKAWARGDPDLESLRGDPRFEALVAPAPPAVPAESR